MPESSLDLGLIGNGSFGALVDKEGRVVWCCLPAFDGDPAFCALLQPKLEGGDWTVELQDFDRSEQHYVDNTAVLRTVLHDRHGGAVEITDFAPRWRQHGRFYRPVMLVRRLRPLAGNPRIRIHLRPLADWGAALPERTWGSNHLRFLLPGMTLRLTTDAPLRLLREALPFVLERELHCVLGPDETLTQPIDTFARNAEQQTIDYWREWVRYLSIPLEWQDAVIRSAITLKLCQYEDTGGIVAAVTTSIPEAPHTPRNWDYRYCWLRDSAFVVRALNRLGATRSMEEYIGYIFNLVSGDESALQPVYGIGFERTLAEDEVDSLAGYRGMGPVRRGNLAWLQQQHDVYGAVVLSSAQLFFDQRLDHPGDISMFHRLEPLGEHAFGLHDQPDAGLWEFRGRAHVHTYSSVMCWAACDRLAKIAARFGLADRDAHWRERRRPPRCVAAAAGRPGLRPRRRFALHRHGRGDRARAQARPRPVPLHRTRRFRRAGNQLHHLHVLVHRRAGVDRPPRRGPRTVRTRAGAAQPPGIAVRGPRVRQRRGMGQLPADLFARGPDHRRDGAEPAVAGRGMTQRSR